MTVNDLLRQLSSNLLYKYFMHGKTTIVINEEIIPVTDYDQRKLHEDDDIRVYPMSAGG